MNMYNDRSTKNLHYVYEFNVKDDNLFENRTEGRYLNEKLQQAFVGSSTGFISCNGLYVYFDSKLTESAKIHLRDYYGIVVDFTCWYDVTVNETKERLNERIKELTNIGEYSQARILLNALEQIDKEKMI